MADLSPELAAKIETLKAQHAENPARFFMPLASAYREAGETARAEELLRENLKRHPGYLSAHVLLGRCLADRGAVAEARNEFQYVLSVDPQNLIALRTLGEMAAGRGERAEAERWYRELLAVDPMSADARDALASLDAAPAPSAAASGAPAASPAEPQDDFGMVDLSAPAPELEAPGADHDFGTWRDMALDADAAPESAASSEPASFDAFEFGAVDLDTPAPAVPEEPLAHEEPPVPHTPAGADAWGSVDDGQDAPEVEPIALEGYFEEEPPRDAEEDEVVTETMAELYARQGFTDRAADVYRELIARRGPEPALVRRLGELERELSGTGAEADGEGGAGDDLPFLDTSAFGGASGETPSHDFGAFDGELPPVEFEPPRPLGPSASELPAAGLAPDFGPFDADLPSGADAAPADPGASSGFDPFDTELPAPAEAAGEAPPSWLQTVDAVVSGRPVETPADTPPPAVPDEVGALAGDLDGPVEASPALDDAGSDAEPGAAEGELNGLDYGSLIGGPLDAAGAPAPAATGDAFADSFAHGFDGAAGEPPTDRAEWEAPTVEPTEPVADLLPAVEPEAETPEVPSFAAEETLAPVEEAPSLVADETPAPVPAFAASAGGETITGYLSAILAWRPGQGAAPAAAAPPADDALPPPVEAWDERTLGAEGTETPLEEPWIAESPAAAEPDAPEAEEPWAAAPDPEPAGTAEDDPWVVAPEEEAPAEEMPWLAPEPAAPEASQAPEAPSGEAPMPWEVGFDISDDAAGAPPAEREAPRAEPTAGEGGFSFEDFFSEAPAEPEPVPAAPAPQPEPAAYTPPPAPAPQPPATEAPAPPQPAAQAADDDEDLESFQAWLQSLKR